MTITNEKVETIAHGNSSLVDEAICSTAKDDNNSMKVASIDTTIDEAKEDFVYSLEEKRLLKKINYTTVPFIFIVFFSSGTIIIIIIM